ncbi:hypothetical protein [Micromonospora chalcea]|uniref:hypothetical protein n=1 Tax=Micromonospora chalcea TaxID=1874 RepID=UPI003D707D13
MRERPKPRPGTLRARRRAEAEQRRAGSRREIHEKRITEAASPLDQLSRAFGWLMTECKRKPGWIPRAFRTVRDLAREINGGGSDEPDHDERH